MPSWKMTGSSAQRRSQLDYTVAFICPMGVELAAVEGMLDEFHDPLPPTRNQSAYTLGHLAGHNVVIAAMPQVGNNAAASVATQLLNDFTSIRFALLIGIGGGIPGKDGEHDIRLGDVVVSQSSGPFGGVVQYDMGKVTSQGEFQKGGMLCKAPPLLSASVERLKSKHHREGSRMASYINDMFQRYPRMKEQYSYPGTKHDRLFKATFRHAGGPSCQRCDLSQLVLRTIRHEKEPEVHYGTIASGNAVIKDSITRDKLQHDFNAICVEMEAAGVMDTTLPCLAIRGICDYADSHKNNRWQPYAAATAAAYAKELLVIIPAADVRQATPLSIDDMNSQPVLANNSMSISELALHIPPFLSDFAKVMKCIQDVQDEFAIPPTIMSSVTAHCHGIQTAIARLQRVDIQRAVAFKNQHDRVLQILEAVIIGCKGTLSLIEEYILDFRATAGTEYSNQENVDAKLEAVWNGDDIEELLSQLSGYQSSLTSLLVISESNSVHEIRSLLVKQKLALDDLIERSRISWNKKPASTMTRSGSLRFSIITHSDAFSTTGIYTNQDQDEGPDLALAFDHEIINSRAYRRVMFRRPHRRQKSNETVVQAQTEAPVTSEFLALDLINQDAIMSSPDGQLSWPLSSDAESEANVPTDSQIGPPIASREPAQDPLTFKGGVAEDRPKVIRNFSRRELDTRKSRPASIMSNILTESQVLEVENHVAPKPSKTPFVSTIFTPQSDIKPESIKPLSAESPSQFYTEGPSQFYTESPSQFYKVILLGAGAVGKSPLVLQFISPTIVPLCTEEDFDPTIEDSYRAECAVDYKPVTLEIIDHSGQMEYAGLWEDHIRTCDCIMLVYSIASRRSYQEVLYFIEEISRLTTAERLPMILVGNKCDLHHAREVSMQEGQELADNIMCPFFETSAKSKVNVTEAFFEAVREIRRSRESYIDWMINSFARVTGQRQKTERKAG